MAEVADYGVVAPAGTARQTLARVAGQRWRIEPRVELAKGEGEVGLDQYLDHYEVRRWDGWYLHMTLALFAFAYLVSPCCGPGYRPSRPRRRQCPRLRPRPRSQKGAVSAAGRLELSGDLLPLTVPEIRHVLWAFGQAVSAEATTSVFAWSQWRRHHEARARRWHYQRHLAHA